MLTFNVYYRKIKYYQEDRIVLSFKKDEKGMYIVGENDNFICNKTTISEMKSKYEDLFLYCIKIKDIGKYKDDTVVNIYELGNSVQCSIDSKNADIYYYNKQDCIAYFFAHINSNYRGNRYVKLSNILSYIGNKYKNVLNRFKHQEEWNFEDMISYNKSQLNTIVDKRNELNRKHSNPKPENWLKNDEYITLCKDFKKFYSSYHGLYINYQQTLKINRLINEMERCNLNKIQYK